MSVGTFLQIQSDIKIIRKAFPTMFQHGTFTIFLSNSWISQITSLVMNDEQFFWNYLLVCITIFWVIYKYVHKVLGPVLAKMVAGVCWWTCTNPYGLLCGFSFKYTCLQMLNWWYHSISMETNIYCCFKISREQSLSDEAISICKEIYYLL